MSQIEILQNKLTLARNQIHRVIVGQEDVVEALFITLLSRGHALLIGAPGLAKTLMIQSLAKVLKGRFSRIQFTPDLMPSDITGVELLQDNPDTGQKEFRFAQGPVFCNVLLADEINRTPPKTQSALLQAMQEHQVSAGNRTYVLEEPFFVLATQNPIEQEGTYPLPEAQLDRFTFSLFMNYPQFEQEVQIAALANRPPAIEPVLDSAELLQAQAAAELIPIGEEVVRFGVRINCATRKDDSLSTALVRQYISWGSGPRASQFMVRAARARAFLRGKSHASAEDIAFVAPLVLQHRLVMNFMGQAEGLSVQKIIADIIQKVG